ncbi:hypothetical protein V8F33_004991 [Rhypophila sp. PSN 637]
MPSPYLLAGIGAFVVLVTYGLPLLLAEYFPWRSLWKQRYGRPTPTTKSYAGRTALITGANGAFGSRAARMFATRDIGTLVLADVRNCSPLKSEIEKELKEAGKPVPKILVWQIDMMTFDGCRLVEQKARKELKTLDHVLLAAGILAFNRRESPEGWEHSIQVNFLSTALISLLLLPLLKSSPSNPNPPCLTFVTSFGLYPAAPTMGVPKTGSYLKKMSNNKDGLAQGHQYGRSKGLLLYFARELAARVTAAGKNVTINSADPGSSWTPLTNAGKEMLIPRLLTNFSARDPQFGAAVLVNGASAGKEGHGQIMQDYDTADYPPFMLRKSGQNAQKLVWKETREEFEAKAPEVKAAYALLGDN